MRLRWLLLLLLPVGALAFGGAFLLVRWYRRREEQKTAKTEKGDLTKRIREQRQAVQAEPSPLVPPPAPPPPPPSWPERTAVGEGIDAIRMQVAGQLGGSQGQALLAVVDSILPSPAKHVDTVISGLRKLFG